MILPISIMGKGWDVSQHLHSSITRLPSTRVCHHERGSQDATQQQKEQVPSVPRKAGEGWEGAAKGTHTRSDAHLGGLHHMHIPDGRICLVCVCGYAPHSLHTPPIPSKRGTHHTGSTFPGRFGACEHREKEVKPSSTLGLLTASF